MKNGLFISLAVGMILLLSACSDEAENAAAMGVDFEWQQIDKGSTENPEIRLTGVPSGTRRFMVSLIDLNLNAFDHGSGFVDNDGSGIIRRGTVKGTYNGPDPPFPRAASSASGSMPSHFFFPMRSKRSDGNGRTDCRGLFEFRVCRCNCRSIRHPLTDRNTGLCSGDIFFSHIGDHIGSYFGLAVLEVQGADSGHPDGVHLCRCRACMGISRRMDCRTPA